MHGDMLEREIEPRPGTFFPIGMALFELDKRLAATGITTAYAALSFTEDDPFTFGRAPAVVRDIITHLDQFREELLIDWLVHARYEVSTPGIAPLVADTIDANQVHLLSLTDHTPGQGQYQNIEQYITTVAQWRNQDRAMIAAEFASGKHRQTGPAENWTVAQEVIRLAAQRGIPIASHDDDGLDKVTFMRQIGATISEFPVTLAAAQAARQHGLHVVMGAPNVLRDGSHSGNLSARTALKAGVVDSLAADYYPASLLHAILLLAQHEVVPLHTAVNLVSRNPAAALGLHDRGSIRVGQRADLVLLEMAPRPRVRGTLRGGQPVYWDSQMAARCGMMT
jgi:alpha-D-ribose 1-methylphosphonate 5-triphosphate diphosphatase